MSQLFQKNSHEAVYGFWNLKTVSLPTHLRAMAALENHIYEKLVRVCESILYAKLRGFVIVLLNALPFRFIGQRLNEKNKRDGLLKVKSTHYIGALEQISKDRKILRSLRSLV